MDDASSAVFRRLRGARLGQARFALAVIGLISAALVSCASSDGTSDSCEPYSCACGTGVRESSSAGEAARCQGFPLCDVVADCPNALSGTSKPICESFGDQVINGHSGGCRLPCTTDDECPDGAFCDSFCWFEADN